MFTRRLSRAFTITAALVISATVTPAESTSSRWATNNSESNAATPANTSQVSGQEEAALGKTLAGTWVINVNQPGFPPSQRHFTFNSDGGLVTNDDLQVGPNFVEHFTIAQGNWIRTGIVITLPSFERVPSPHGFPDVRCISPSVSDRRRRPSGRRKGPLRRGGPLTRPARSRCFAITGATARAVRFLVGSPLTGLVEPDRRRRIDTGSTACRNQCRDARGDPERHRGEDQRCRVGNRDIVDKTT